jgi:hypothetical protein
MGSPLTCRASPHRVTGESERCSGTCQKETYIAAIPERFYELAIFHRRERTGLGGRIKRLRKGSNRSITCRACARVLLALADRIETITYDNGKEFASHVETATSLGSIPDRWPDVQEPRSDPLLNRLLGSLRAAFTPHRRRLNPSQAQPHSTPPAQSSGHGSRRWQLYG